MNASQKDETFCLSEAMRPLIVANDEWVTHPTEFPVLLELRTDNTGKFVYHPVSSLTMQIASVSVPVAQLVEQDQDHGFDSHGA